MCIYCEMITTVKVNTSLSSHSDHLCMCVVRSLKIYNLRKFQVDNKVLLTAVTVVYVRSPELVPLILKTCTF